MNKYTRLKDMELDELMDDELNVNGERGGVRTETWDIAAWREGLKGEEER